MAAFSNNPYSNPDLANALRQQQSQRPVYGAPVGQMEKVKRPTDQLFYGMDSTPPKQTESTPIDNNTANMLGKGLRNYGAYTGGTGADIGSAASTYGPEVAKMPGLTGGSTAASGTSGSMAGMMSSMPWLAAMAAAAYGVDKEMNTSDNSVINADKLNNALSYKGIGLRAGDFVNGINPATWLRNPKEGAKGLGNAFTFGLMDKIF